MIVDELKPASVPPDSSQKGPEVLLQVSSQALAKERLAGVTVLERQLFLLKRVGARRVAVAGLLQQGLLRLPDGLELSWHSEAPSARPGTPRAVISADYILQLQTLRSILSNYSTPRRYVDRWREEIASVSSGGEGAPENRCELLLPENYLPLAQTKTAAQRDTWIMATARKPTDGFMARHFDRAISLSISKRLLRTKITPNQMTMISVAIGWMGAACFLQAARFHQLAGALLIWFHSVVDGCDGEIARLTFRESRRGALFDFWGDNLVHLALFGCLAWQLSTERASAPLLGIAACCGTLGSAWLASPHRQYGKKTPSEDIPGRLGRIADALAQRDFIYLLIAAAAFKRSLWFLWSAAVGAPLYFLLALYISIFIE